MFGWGEGREGCLGLGDGKKRLSVVPISFFEDKRCIDVACGENFTVVIAEVFNSANDSNNHTFNSSGSFNLADGLLNKLHKLKNNQ